jgi:hypothetical protein
METTKNKMPEFLEIFLNKMRNYLDTKLYFYGSVQRYDYFPESSDIDIDIFTDNEESTISKLQTFLGVNKDEFKKTVYKIYKTNKIVYGYKVKYVDAPNNLSIELSIYNNKNKSEILEEHLRKINIPFYIVFLLFCLKFVYYKLQILPRKVYYFFKNIFINIMIDGKKADFFLNEIPKNH